MIAADAVKDSRSRPVAGSGENYAVVGLPVMMPMK